MTTDKPSDETAEQNPECFTPPAEAEIAALPRCATCGGIYPLECPPHRVTPPGRTTP